MSEGGEWIAKDEKKKKKKKNSSDSQRFILLCNYIVKCDHNYAEGEKQEQEERRRRRRKKEKNSCRTSLFTAESSVPSGETPTERNAVSGSGICRERRVCVNDEQIR